MCQVLYTGSSYSLLGDVRRYGSTLHWHTGYLPCWLFSERTIVSPLQSGEDTVSGELWKVVLPFVPQRHLCSTFIADHSLSHCLCHFQ